MRIYTKTGDKGKTSLFGGKRVDKNCDRIEAYGTIDELNSIIGIILSEKIDSLTQEFLENIQQSLFVVGSELATPDDVKNSNSIKITESDVNLIEQFIDKLELELEPLHNFILPGGNRSAAFLHFARTVCRRAERKIIDIQEKENINSTITVYVNRLSDLLFVMARYENHKASHSEIEWKPRG